MEMPGRKWVASDYRYSMNGQEHDDEIFKGAMGAEFWEYDSRIGRRWERDPITYPWQSPYATFNNNPIYFSDPTGLEGNGDGNKGNGGKSGETITKNPDGSTSSTITWERGGSCTVNTPAKPEINIDKTPNKKGNLAVIIKDGRNYDMGGMSNGNKNWDFVYANDFIEAAKKVKEYTNSTKKELSNLYIHSHGVYGMGAIFYGPNIINGNDINMYMQGQTSLNGEGGFDIEAGLNMVALEDMAKSVGSKGNLCFAACYAGADNEFIKGLSKWLYSERVGFKGTIIMNNDATYFAVTGKNQENRQLDFGNTLNRQARNGTTIIKKSNSKIIFERIITRIQLNKMGQPITFPASNSLNNKTIKN